MCLVARVETAGYSCAATLKSMLGYKLEARNHMLSGKSCSAFCQLAQCLTHEDAQE